MVKVHVIADRVFFRCVACKQTHMVYTSDNAEHKWTFDGNEDAPTISPSLLIREVENGERTGPVLCHVVVSAGQLQYQNDHPGEFSGKTVSMVDW